MAQIPPSLPNLSYLVGSTSENPSDIGFAQASDPSSGDSLQIDPNMSTDYSGIQAAVSATIDKGGENLLQFGNGDVAVTTGTGDRQNTISEVKQGDHEELYGVKAGSSGRDDLGDASSSSSWNTALQEGYSTQQGTKDLQTLLNQGLGGISQVASTFGFSAGSAGVQQAISGLMDSAQEQVQKSGNAASEGTKSNLDDLSKILGITPVPAASPATPLTGVTM
jgi:hypothetical protein